MCAMSLKTGWHRVVLGICLLTIELKVTYYGRRFYHLKDEDVNTEFFFYRSYIIPISISFQLICQS